MQDKLTKKLLDTIKPAPKAIEIKDTEVPGFGAWVLPSGIKSFFVYYRFQGQRRRPSLGIFPGVSVEKARELAKKYLGDVAHGIDPSRVKQDARKIDSLKAFSIEFMKDAKRRTKPRTQEENQRRLNLHILPALGSKRLNQITQQDIVRLHQKTAEVRMVEHEGKRPYPTGGELCANRVLALMRAMYNKAIEWGLVGENPAVHITPYPEKRRERFLTADELQRLGAAFAWAEVRETLENSEWKKDSLGKRRKATSRPTPWATAAVKLLLYTGARRNEILCLRWEHVDFEEQCLRLPDSKTGAKVIHLNKPALETLQALYRTRTKDCPWVIEGHVTGARMVNIQSAWARIRGKANLPGLRLHDLRHAHASLAVMSGINLPIVAKILGHSTTRMTERYAHLAADPVLAASEQIGMALIEAMNGTAKVVDVTTLTQDQGEEAGEGK